MYIKIKEALSILQVKSLTKTLYLKQNYTS